MRDTTAQCAEIITIIITMIQNVIKTRVYIIIGKIRIYLWLGNKLAKDLLTFESSPWGSQLIVPMVPGSNPNDYTLDL